MKKIIFIPLFFIAVVALAGTGIVVDLPESEITTHQGSRSTELAVTEENGRTCLYVYNAAVAGGTLLSCATTSGDSIVSYVSTSGDGEIGHGDFRVWNDASLGDEIVIGNWTNNSNHPYETLTVSNRVISEATNTTGYGMVWSSNSLDAGTYEAVYTMVSTSGAYPYFRVATDASLAFLLSIYSAVTESGSNVESFTVPTSGTYYLGYRVENHALGADADTFAVSGFSLRPATGGNMAATGLFTGGGAKGIDVDLDGIVTISENAHLTNLRVWDASSLGSEMATGWTTHVTHPYETFLTTGTTITSAINTTGYGICYETGGIDVKDDRLYAASFTITLNSGIMPYFRVGEITLSSSLLLNRVPESGANTFYFYGTATGTKYIGFKALNNHLSNFSVADFSVKEVTAGDITGATAKFNTLTVGSSGTALTSLTTGTFTLASAATTTVSNTAVTAGSRIFLQAMNATAATLVGSAASPYINTLSAGASFTVTTADGAAAAGTEAFFYQMLN